MLRHKFRLYVAPLLTVVILLLPAMGLLILWPHGFGASGEGSLDLEPSRIPLWLFGACLIPGLAVLVASKARGPAVSRIEAMFSGLPVGMLVLDQRGRIVSANRACEQLFHYANSELAGLWVEAVLPGFTEPAAECEKPASPSPRRLEGKCRDGSPLAVELCTTPIATSNGSFRVVTVLDVQEPRHHGQQLSHYVTALERSNHNLSHFAALACHDLGAPLRHIKQLLEWIHEGVKGDLDENSARYFALIDSRIRRLQTLHNDLLDYAQIASRQHEIRAVDCRALLIRCFELSAVTGRETLHLSGDDLPVIKAQEVPLALVFRNLFANAIKHNDKAQVEVSVEYAFKPSSNCHCFAVADNGPGIAVENREKIFEPFKTLKGKDQRPGSGLGLSLVRKILQGVNGEVRVCAGPEGGTCFTVEWPAAAQACQMPLA